MNQSDSLIAFDVGKDATERNLVEHDAEEIATMGIIIAA
jgi:hypothetical protein